MMKFAAFIVIGLALVAGLAAGAPSNLSEELEAASAAVTPAASSRASFQWPKLFDFENYKRQFHKHYGSLAENIVRHKIYLAKAFRVFIAAIKYRCRQMKYFLRINPRSDWTPREVLQSFMGPSSELASDTMLADRSFQSAEESAFVTKGPKKEPRTSVSAEELNALDQQVSTDQRELTFDRLMSGPDEPSQPEQSDEFVPSNNQNYEPPRLAANTSGKASKVAEKKEAEESGKPWSVEAAERYQLAPGAQSESALGVLPGYNYISSVVRSTLGMLHSGLVGENAQAELADEVFWDHRDSGCITQPRDQQQCRACYIFTYVALYEWLYCKLKGRPVKLSEQYIKDCGSRVGMRGCGGGSMFIVPSFVEKYGLELAANYPYSESQGTCPYDNSTDPAKMGYLRLDTGALANENVSSPNFEQFLVTTPMAVYLKTSSDFNDYGGGVHTNDECLDSHHHAMLLIGHGREDGEEYWLIKNSHGVWFGEQGYYKVSKKVACFGEDKGFMFMNSFFNTVAEKENRNYDGEPLKKAHLKRLRDEFDRLVEVDLQAERSTAKSQEKSRSSDGPEQSTATEAIDTQQPGDATEGHSEESSGEANQETEGGGQQSETII